MPASSANLGPGFDCMAAALSLQLELEVAETGSVRRRDRPAGGDGAREPRACARSSACTRPTASSFRIRSEIPLSGGLGSSAAAIVAGLMAADHMFELDADLLAARARSRGTPTTSPPRCYGGFVICADGEAARFDPPTGLEALAVVPDGAGAHARCPRGAAARGADRGGGVQRRPRRAADPRPGARATGTCWRAGLQDRLHQERRAHLFPRSFELAGRARELGALGATISGAGPTVLVWCFYEQTGASPRRSRGEVGGLGERAARVRSSRRAPTWTRSERARRRGRGRSPSSGRRSSSSPLSAM